MSEQRPPYGSRLTHAQLDREMETVTRVAQLASLIDYDRLFVTLEQDGATLYTLPQPMRRRVEANRERVKLLAQALQAVARIEQETQP